MGKVLIVILLSAALISGCGSSNNSSDAPGNGRTVSPEVLGQQIGATYIEMMASLQTLAESRPVAAEMKRSAEAMKTEYIDRFVAFGRTREQMTEPDRMRVESATLAHLSGNGSGDVQWLNEAIRYYSADPSIGATLSSMNILTQYAFFDLLKRQSPAEAERLGIR